jgi:histidinol-phosphatase (PHP family)
MLPPDGHVHSEWSWDAIAGSMERSCARAVELGLPSIAFTEHADFTRSVVAPRAGRLLFVRDRIGTGDGAREKH